MTAETVTPHVAERWLGIHDDLLRGLAHAISNRLATITAAAGVLDVRETPDPRFLEGLRNDADRLDGLLTLMRQLPRRADAGLEPMLLSDALETARRLLDEHPDIRGRTIAPVVIGDVVPARGEPTAVMHAMVVAMLGASRCGPGPVTVEMETVGDIVRVAARVDSRSEETRDHAIEDDARTISWLLRSSSGRGIALPGGCAIEVPTLQASRRRPG